TRMDVEAGHHAQRYAGRKHDGGPRSGSPHEPRTINPDCSQFIGTDAARWIGYWHGMVGSTVVAWCVAIYQCQIRVCFCSSIKAVTTPVARWSRIVCSVLLLVAIAIYGGQAAYLTIKAQLAQVLLLSAWDRSQLNGEVVKPWPW